MSDVEEREVSAVEKFAGRAGRMRNDARDLRDAFEEARPYSREDIMLDVRFSTNARRAFSYAYLVSIEFEPGDQLRLVFGSEVLRLEGRRLTRLYESLTQHRVRCVQEGSLAEDGLKPEDAPHIERIDIEQTKEDS